MNKKGRHTHFLKHYLYPTDNMLETAIFSYLPEKRNP